MDYYLKIFLDSLWPIFKAGLLFTVPLTLISFVLGLILAVLTALARLSGIKPLVWIARFYVWIIRGTPLLVQLFIIFFGLPRIGITLDAFTAAVIGFTLSVGAYNSEVIRAAILSIPTGQWEAAQSLGMTRTQTLKRIILPQAARVSVPPLSNAFISLVKDTSLAASITLGEMFQRSQQIASMNYEHLLMYSEVALFYLFFSTILSMLQGRVEKYFERYVVR